MLFLQAVYIVTSQSPCENLQRGIITPFWNAYLATILLPLGRDTLTQAHQTVVSDRAPVPWKENEASTMPSNDAVIDFSVIMTLPV